MVKPEINVTPLIDVLLVLLIIFMVVTPVKPSKFETRIPSELSKFPAGIDPLTLVVVVDREGNLSLNSQSFDATAASPEGVVEKLRSTFAIRETNMVNQRTVFIKAPKSIGYGTVARVVDAIQTAGGSPISLQIDELEN